MAERRMLKRRITSSDAFVGLSSAAQALYMHLNLDADDDGFNDQVQTAMNRAHASTDDLNILLVRGFIYRFENGVIVIKHWRLHNLLRKDRYKPTDYLEEIDRLEVKENGEYVFRNALGCQMVAKWLPQDSQGEDSIVLSKESARTHAHAHARAQKKNGESAPDTPTGSKFTFKIPTVDEVRAYSDECSLGLDAERFVDFYTSKGWMIGKSRMKDWRAAARNWSRREREAQAREGGASFDVGDFFDAAIKKTYEGGDKQ